MIEERLMAAGSWSLKLVPTTPQSVRDTLDFFGHLVVTPTRIDPRQVGDAPTLGLARYTGVLRAKPTPYELEGPGLAMWLGDEDGKGQVIEGTPISKTAGSFSSWVSSIRPSSLSAGAVTAIAGGLTWDAQLMSRRAALDYVCDYFAGEWRVNPDGSLDAGPASSLFVVTPTAVVMRRGGGADLNIRGLDAETMNRAIDSEDYTTKVVVVAGGRSEPYRTGSATISPATAYKDLLGGAVQMTRLVESSDTAPGNEANVAQAQLNAFSATRKAITLSARLYDIGRAVKAGDTIHVFDPETGLVDTANQVQYRGQQIFPVALRVRAVRWPIEVGLGVFYRDRNGVYTDLSQWVEWESGAAELEVGVSSRTAADSLQAPVPTPPPSADAWASYTPALTSTGTAPTMNAANRTGKYVRFGKRVSGWARFTFSALGAGEGLGTGTYRFSLPSTPASPSSAGATLGPASYEDAGTRRYVGVASYVSGSTAAIHVDGGSEVSATAPVVPANGDVWMLRFDYEEA